MLSKQVCQICLKKRPNHRWSKADELQWGKGKFICVVRYRKLKLTVEHSVNDLPPNDCPYFLEHLMQINKNRAK